MESKLKHLKELKEVLSSLNIKHSDVCVVGSAVLALHGIRMNNDIDIIVSKEKRDAILKTKDAIGLSDNVECVKQGWFLPLEPIDDDQIIFNSKLHFFHDKIKFCNLDMVIQKKKKSSKEKDKRDMDLLNDKR